MRERERGRDEPEGNKVRRSIQVPLLVRPEGTRRSYSRLYFIDDEEDAVFLRECPERVEECIRGVVVSSLCSLCQHISLCERRGGGRTGLDGLDDESSDRPRLLPLDDRSLHLREGPRLRLCVLRMEVLEGVLEQWEGDGGPVERGDVELVDGLGAGEREGAEHSTVEGRFERHDRQVGRSGRLVLHARRELQSISSQYVQGGGEGRAYLLGCESFDANVCTLSLAVREESSLHRTLHSARSTHLREQMRKTCPLTGLAFVSPSPSPD
jgi:hypothetical protein